MFRLRQTPITTSWLAASAEQDGDFDAALKEYEQAYRLNPSDAEIALSLAALSLSRGQLDQATLYAKKAVELQPDKTQFTLMLLPVYIRGKEV